MQRLKRVITNSRRIGYIEMCERCSGHVQVISRIEDPSLIEKILQHLASKESTSLPCIHGASGRQIRRRCSRSKSPLRLDHQRLATVTWQDEMRFWDAFFKKFVLYRAQWSPIQVGHIETAFTWVLPVLAGNCDKQ